MSNIYYSADGNPEIWDSCPEGYVTEAAWLQKQTVEKKQEEEAAYQESILPVNLYPVKYKEINDTYEKYIDRLNKKYPEMEQSTFYRQLAEATGILNHTTTDTPFIDNVAKQRNMSRLALAQSIYDNADKYAAVAGYLTGKKYKLLQDLGTIDTATTESLLALNIDFSIVDEEVI